MQNVSLKSYDFIITFEYAYSNFIDLRCLRLDFTRKKFQQIPVKPRQKPQKKVFYDSHTAL